MIRWIPLALLGGLLACGDKTADDDEEAAFIDNDGDGYPGGQDCDDWSGVVYPGAPEVCDGVDNNCDGQIDEDAARTFYLDSDGDGYGLESDTIDACLMPSGYADEIGDCDDDNPDANPGEPSDVCDSVDNDCDDEIDEDVTYADYYIDEDEDGYGTDDDIINDCTAPDCDDDNAHTYPSAPERCDLLDNDCDGQIDNDVVEEWFPDSDGDGWGDPYSPLEDCDPEDGYITTPDDCDDSDAGTNPEGVELCDSVDNDCDDETDEDSCYVSWEGVEVYEQGRFSVPTQRDCEIYWNMSGERAFNDCDSCEFVFDVTMTYDSAASSDNGTCAASNSNWPYGTELMADIQFSYGYTSDYTYYGYSYGPTFMVDFYGYWYPMTLFYQVGLTDLDSSDKLTYKYGYKDYEYAGVYYTYYHYGYAQLK